MTRNPRIIPRALAAAALSSALLLSGCATSGGAAPSSAGATEPHSGGEVVHAVAAIAEGWQQQQSNNWYKSQVWAQLVETLVFVDDEGVVYPWLADSWEVSDDGLSYTIVLRDGVTFSDGTPLTATTVARNLDILGLGDPDNGIVRSNLIPIEYAGAEAIDDRTVRVTLSSPNGGFIPSLGFFAAGIVGDATLDLPLEEQSLLENVVGTGPFVFESEDIGSKVVVVRRDDYDWPSPAFDHTGPAYLDQITFAAVAEDTARLGALESGQIDSLHFVQPSEELRLQDEGWNVIYGQYLGTPINFVLRPDADIVSDVRVRQALQVGINRAEIVSTVFNENWKAATSSVQQASPGWVDLSAELAYDPDRAGKLLDQAGWTTTNDEGIRTKDGQTLTLPGYTSPFLNTSPAIIELIAQQLKTIGIELAITKTDATTYTDIFNNPATPIAPTANTFLDLATLKGYWGLKGTNQFKLTTDVLEPYLDDVAETTAGTDERDTAARALQQETIQQAYTVPLVDNYQTYVTSPELHGLITNAVGRPYFYAAWKE
jgi:peptide/nickel transport system substrate-binding protein